MKNEFVPYSPALRLKALGFNEPCLKWFIWRDKGDYQCVSDFYDFPIDEDGGISAPTWQSAFRWFREKYELCSWVTMELGNKSTFCWILSGEHISTQYAAYFHTYEEAELACLIKLIEIVENI